MTRKFFHAENANRSIQGIIFEPYEIFAGTVLGIYSTEDAKELEILSKLVADKSSGVTEINADEFAAFQKKKARSLSDFVPSSPPLSKPPAVTMKGEGATVVESPIP